LALLWGPSFLFIKVAVYEVPPLTLAAVRVGIAAVLLYVVLRVQGRNLPRFGSVWKHFAVMGLVSNALPFVLFSWGEQYIDSALAAILNGATPLFTIVLAHFFTTDEDLTPNQGVGVLLGFAGLMVLMAPELAGGMQATSWGLLAMIVASFSYGVAIVYARRNLRGLPPLVAPAAQLSMATLYLVPLSLFVERPYTLAMPSWPAIGSLFTLAAFGTALAFVIYYRIMEQASATSLSMVTYMVPIVGTVLGVVVLNEQLGWNVYAGCALILLGVMIVNGVFRLVGWQRLTNLGARP
jgi:drug/metabolite transporter (DMT)-like permease